ncbi:MAG: lysine biosynthesis protein LysX [Candidatus Asgardarchaeia archaeon]
MDNILYILYDRIRWDEKAIIKAAQRKNVPVKQIDLKRVLWSLQPENDTGIAGFALQRAVSYFRGLFSTAVLEKKGIRVVNNFEVSLITGNKLLTSLFLTEHKIPMPSTFVTFDLKCALDALDKLGYPQVLKPIYGSWGRFVALLKDRETASTILDLFEDRGPLYKTVYLQEAVDRPNRDIRSFVIGDEVVTAIYRYAPPGDWKTNTACGGRAEKCPLTDELVDLSLKVAEVLGADILGIDLMETKDGLVVHEANHNTEFHTTVPTTGVDIPGLIVDYMVNLMKR